MAAAALVSAAPADAQIAANTVQTGSGYSYQGQSFTPGAAGTSYNGITFSFQLNGSNTAAGTLYLFNTRLVGTPDDLATYTTPGGSFLGTATADASSTVFTFDPTLTLTGGSTYYAYTNAEFYSGVQSPGAYTGGTRFYSNRGDFAFITSNLTDQDFVVNGSAVSSSAVPEPTGWAMLILGVGGMGAVLRRRPRQALHLRHA